LGDTAISRAAESRASVACGKLLNLIISIGYLGVAMDFKVFICYKRRTAKDFAVHLKAGLEDDGIHAFLDILDIPKEVSGTEGWADAINEAIEDCRIFLLILTHGFDKSNEIKRELALARKFGDKTFIYLRHEHLNPNIMLTLGNEKLSLGKMEQIPFGTKEDLLRQACKVLQRKTEEQVPKIVEPQTDLETTIINVPSVSGEIVAKPKRTRKAASKAKKVAPKKVSPEKKQTLGVTLKPTKTLKTAQETKQYIPFQYSPKPIRRTQLGDREWWQDGRKTIKAEPMPSFQTPFPRFRYPLASERDQVQLEYVQELLKLKGHRSLYSRSCSIWHCAWSPNGERIVSASEDKKLKIWDAQTGQELQTLKGHSSGVEWCAWSPDGQRILSASENHTTLKVWNAKFGQELLTVKARNKYAVKGVWSSDGQRILIASGDGTITIWDAKTGQQLQKLQEKIDWGSRYVWSPDGQRILTISFFKSEAKVWDAKTGQQLQKLKGHANLGISAVWSPDGRYILSGNGEGILTVWDAKTGNILRKIHGTTQITSCAWSPDRERILSGLSDGTIKVWSARRPS